MQTSFMYTDPVRPMGQPSVTTSGTVQPDQRVYAYSYPQRTQQYDERQSAYAGRTEGPRGGNYTNNYYLDPAIYPAQYDDSIYPQRIATSQANDQWNPNYQNRSFKNLNNNNLWSYLCILIVIIFLYSVLRRSRHR